MLYVPKFYYRTVWENRSRTERIKAAVKTPSAHKESLSSGSCQVRQACSKKDSKGRWVTELRGPAEQV